MLSLICPCFCYPHSLRPHRLHWAQSFLLNTTPETPGDDLVVPRNSQSSFTPLTPWQHSLWMTVILLCRHSLFSGSTDAFSPDTFSSHWLPTPELFFKWKVSFKRVSSTCWCLWQYILKWLHFPLHMFSLEILLSSVSLPNIYKMHIHKFDFQTYSIPQVFDCFICISVEMSHRNQKLISF